MIHGRTHLYEFTRDDGTISVIEYKCSPYEPGYTFGPPEICYPPEGGELEEWEADNGETVLTDAEAERLETEIMALPPDRYEEDYGDGF